MMLFFITSCSSDEDLLDAQTEYVTYKVLVTFKNCDIVEENGRSTIIMSDESRVTELYLLEPEPLTLDKRYDIIKSYNTYFVSDEARPSELPEGPNTIGFTISVKSPETKKVYTLAVNVNVMYSKDANPTRTFTREYTIRRKILRETVDNLNSMIESETVPEGFVRYKLLVTYENADLIKEGDKEYILISDETKISNVEIIEPEYAILNSVLKFYDGKADKLNQVPSDLTDGYHVTSFALTVINPVVNRTLGLALNVNIKYNKNANPHEIIKRLYTIDKETTKETLTNKK